MELLKRISTHIDVGDFDIAEDLSKELLSSIKQETINTENGYNLLFNLTGLFIDLGHMSKKKRFRENRS